MTEGSRSSFSSSPVPSEAAAWKRSTRNSDLRSALKENKRSTLPLLSSSYKRPYPRSNKRKAAKCGEDGHQNCFNLLQESYALVIRTAELQGLLGLDGHHLDGDRDNMVRRTREVRRDLKPPYNPRSNGALLVSIDEEMRSLRFQRQQRHVCHGQTHASATSSFRKILLYVYCESGM